MEPVVADTSPLNYLILIEAVDILPRLFSRVLIPGGVQLELSHPKAPRAVSSWIANPPAWLNIVKLAPVFAAEPHILHQGERQAIALAAKERAALLMDDSEGVSLARQAGLEVVGTLSVVIRAAQRGWVDLPDMFRRLRATTFRSPIHLMARLLEEDALRNKR